VGSLLDEDCDGVRCCKAGGGWPAGGCNEKVVPSGDICLSTFHGVAGRESVVFSRRRYPQQDNGQEWVGGNHKIEYNAFG